MNQLAGLGFSRHALTQTTAPDRTEFILVQRPLQRILAFTRRSIDEVVNDPVAKNEVLGYYKLHKRIARAAEIRDLERQWNAVA